MNGKKRENNFNLVRTLAALAVMVGHMSAISASKPVEFAENGVHSIGLAVLFLIGGYLIAGSWESDPHPARYAIRRFVRLWPPYAVFVLIITFIAGPLLSELGPSGYFACHENYYLHNLRFYIIFALPGVFTHTPYPNVVNGSLWTMPVEAVVYVLCPLVLAAVHGVAKRTKNPQKTHDGLIFAAAVAVCTLEAVRMGFAPDLHLIAYATDWTFGLALFGYFLMGMAYRAEWIRKRLDMQKAVIALVLILFVRFGEAADRLLLMLALPYCVFSFALAPNPKFANFATKNELSYGIYLYGFFFQQLAVEIFNVRLGLGLPFGALLLASLPPTLGAAWLSSKLVENPLIALSGRLLARWKDADKRRTAEG